MVGIRQRARPRAVPLGLALFAVVAVGALVFAKWLPYSAKTVTLAGTGEWSSATPLATGDPGPATGWAFLLSYTGAVWPALLAAILLGAAVEALVPTARLRRMTPLGGGLLALPGMMCTCCTAPLVTSLRRSGLAPGSAASFWLANPVLNPAVLVFLALVGPWQWPLTRLLVGVALVFGVGLLVARMLPGEAPGGTAPPAVAADPRPAPRRLATALARFTVLLVPEYAVLVFAVGSLGARLHPLAAGTERHLVPALLVAAVLGLLVVIPTGGEIPVLLAATAVGLPPAVAGVLLITLPAVSLPSMLMVGRALTWRVTGTVAACVTGAGLAAGALLTALSG